MKNDSKFAIEVVNSLSILYYSDSLESFQENLASFLTHWGTKCPPYRRYFEQQWINGQWPPSSWAQFGRGVNALSGDQPIEGWHLRSEEFQ